MLFHGFSLLYVAMESVTSRGMHTVHSERGEDSLCLFSPPALFYLYTLPPPSFLSSFLLPLLVIPSSSSLFLPPLSRSLLPSFLFSPSPLLPLLSFPSLFLLLSLSQTLSHPSLFSQSKVGEFLQLAGSTLLSFLEAYRDSAPPDETHPEAQFVLALCGTITSEIAVMLTVHGYHHCHLIGVDLDIAASTYGRDFLCNCEDGTRLIDTLCSVLGTTPLGQQ